MTIVGIGASAGGLEAATALIKLLPVCSEMAFILVQHLEPSHKSMLVDLLSVHTTMAVRQATDCMPIEPATVYVIPPGASLSVDAGVLRVSPLPTRHGVRLPFDALLASMAEQYGARAACVVLSGTGADGSVGLLTIKAKGGLVVAQDPREAGYDGMPRSAIQTGGVGAVLRIADIPAALIVFHAAPEQPLPASSAEAAGPLPAILELLRTKTQRDYTCYKPGTLHRRVERRMAMTGIKPCGMAEYLDVLRKDEHELGLLANDLLIHVTGFFRDAPVFDYLAKTAIPELVASHASDRPLRVWVAGCSTGQETYSLAMLFLEAIQATGRPIKLQIFASDIDADAIAVARAGTYPALALDGVPADRMSRFFSQDESGWRAVTELRAAIVFTVQDVLIDPPFSRLDMVSCRNLLIYLQPDTQAKVIDAFHFSLREGGLLLLGSAETVVEAAGRFEIVAKRERIYRRLGRGTASPSISLAKTAASRPADTIRVRAVPATGRPPSRPEALAELGRRLVLDAYAPATILLNPADEILFTMGPTERYLRLPQGHASQNVLAMARPGLRARLATALTNARATKAGVKVDGRVEDSGQTRSFTIEIRPVPDREGDMLLVSFVEAAARPLRDATPAGHRHSRITELEQELDATRTDLLGTVRTLEMSAEEQKGIHQEAISVNEEYQSTNEELVASKEEMQSLNEELTALNSQLQETLERQRTTSDDLQNVLYSTNVATLFLDPQLRIRLFTPSIKPLFDLLPSDVGRPLAAFAPAAPDSALEADARAVLARLEPMEREIETTGGTWFRRRILPYRAHGDRVEGVVITFTDISARKTVARALELAKKQAETANVAKSRFLAAASHDLRQPLQTLSLLQALLARTVVGEKAQALVARQDSTLAAMVAMLDTLLDINEIEAGTVCPDVAPFALDQLFDRLREEFTTLADAKGLVLHVVPCSLSVLSDQRLLEQMLRNLLANALKYTSAGRVLLGARRRGADISLEVWDTGIGIPEDALDAIFEEYRQIGNAARERSRGVGLGLSIVKRLGGLLGHAIGVRSRHGHGSGFSVQVPLAQDTVHAAPPALAADEAGHRSARILVVEDDPDLREMLARLLTEQGHRTATAPDGPTALAQVAREPPDLVLADYNLPNGPNGLELAAALRRTLGRDVPVIILTGDIRVDTQRDVALKGCTLLSKPVGLPVLQQTIARMLAGADDAAEQPAETATAPLIFVVDDDDGVRGAIAAILENDGRVVLTYPTGEAFLSAYRPGGEGCLLIDAHLPGMNGFDLIERLRAMGDGLPAIMITGQGDVPMAVRAMAAGASNFIEKPVGRDEMLASVARALDQSHDASKLSAWRDDASRRVATLTYRQRQVMTLVLAGQPSKNIAADLGISQRTVENHRAAVMRRTGSGSLPDLARLALAAAFDEPVVLSAA